MSAKHLTLADVKALRPHWRALFEAAAKRNLGGSMLMREMHVAWLKHAYPLLFDDWLKRLRAGGKADEKRRQAK